MQGKHSNISITCISKVRSVSDLTETNTFQMSQENALETVNLHKTRCPQNPQPQHRLHNYQKLRRQ